MGTIDGTVTYRERSTLPPGAEVRVTLEDVARMDTPAEIISDTRWTPQGRPPFPFQLEYDADRLQPQGRYALRAVIEAQTRLLFTSTGHISALADGPIEIVVTRTSTRLAPEGVPDASLTNTYWKVVELNGSPVHTGRGQREPHLVLDVDGAGVRGDGGCNRFTGSYELDGSALRFGPLASTRRLCPEGMEQEQTLLAMLAQVARFTIAGDHLVLLSAAGRPVAYCDAVWLS